MEYTTLKPLLTADAYAICPSPSALLTNYAYHALRFPPKAYSRPLPRHLRLSRKLGTPALISIGTRKSRYSSILYPANKTT